MKQCEWLIKAGSKRDIIRLVQAVRPGLGGLALSVLDKKTS
jgi:hypothetical protein